ncbi:MFS transporter [Nostoc sp. FACHB-152]|uniref:MFS transporter n=1 Tax=unclassified Nostoc TaxID=2593658 RepID=UPI0016890BED|nr:MULTISPECIES: MFS transporter [unclassified Nostoc]MBD2445824.1 MFS transporter [Nostoc sp. FACHB-152]MBD2468001.1 MFS transporter [Nostoc sp. FACHB-145]
MTQPNSESLLTKATLLAVSSLTVMAGATIAPSLPAMQDHFTEVANVEFWVRLVLTMPALFIVIGSPIAGIIVDRLGRKPLLLTCAALYGFAGCSGFFLNSLFAILGGRAFLGLAVAGIMVSATTLIADYYVGAARATFMGLQAAFMGLGGVIFLSVGGSVAEVNWRYPFLIYLFAWVLLPLILISIYEPRRHNWETQPQENQENVNFATPTNLLILIFGITTLSQIIFYLIPVQLPFYLRTLTKATPVQSGLAIALITLFSAFASMGYGAVKRRLDFVTILPIIFAFLGIGYTIIGTANSYAIILLGLAIAGLGLGLLMPNMNVWLSASVPDAIRGRALGGLSTSMFLGQFLSPILSQPISQNFGLGTTYTLSGGLLVVLAIAFTVMKRQVKNFTAAKAL